MNASCQFAATMGGIILVAAGMVTDLAAQMCSGSALPEKLLVELSAVERIQQPRIGARVFGQTVYAEVGLGRGETFGSYSYGSDADGVYLARWSVRLDEARAGVGWRLPVGRSELCVLSRVTWSKPNGAEEDRYSVDAFGRIGPLRSTVEVANPSWNLLTVRGGLALGTELLPDWRAGLELFGRQRRYSDRALAEEPIAEAGLVGVTSVVLARRIQLRVAFSWVGWNDVDGSDETYDWVTAGVGVLF